MLDFGTWPFHDWFSYWEAELQKRSALHLCKTKGGDEMDVGDRTSQDSE